MGAEHAYGAVDLGAESGRVVRGVLREGRLRLEEVKRFENGMVGVLGRECWNLVRLYEGMLEGFKLCAGAEGGIESIGVDSWGVDFVLLGEGDVELGRPVAYRDGRTEGMMERFFERVPRERVYERTGIQFMRFNSIYQLYAMAQGGDAAAGMARRFLMVPDYFHYLFTGVKTNEYTNASTTQLLNVGTREWDGELIGATGVGREIFGELLGPGSVIGPVTGQMRELTGLGEVAVVAPATHDTASAVVAAPGEGDGWAYISSGTWSLMGIEADRPMATAKAYGYNFTNEGGVFGTTRFLKNIMGLWLVQRCRADFGGERDYGELVRLAEAAEPFASLVDPDCEEFLNPVSMTEAIAGFCRRTGQRAPGSEGAFVRCCLESLAMQYRRVLERLGDVYGRRFERVHIVGGGCRNRLLNQFAADAMGVEVVAGPVEATVVGNVLMQAIGLGHLGGLGEARGVVRDSFGVEVYEPRDRGRWGEEYGRFLAITGGALGE